MLEGNEARAMEATLVEAVNLALAHEMERDESVLLLGEDIGVNGGVFRATNGLQKRFGAERVIDTPLAESAIAGVAVGMAAMGLKPVAEIQFTGFYLSYNGSDDQSRVANASSHARAPDVPYGAALTFRRGNPCAGTSLRKSGGAFRPYAGTACRYPVFAVPRLRSAARCNARS